ncbi:MAG: MCE family protein [Planctomycetes bacterium]|nr:MCE family protein [Planctomycetota bacterium]
MTDYQTKQRQRNLIVGGFVVVAIFAFIFMLVKFRDLPLIVSKFKSFEILVYFPEAPGIQNDTPVNYCGVQIGRVRHVADPQISENEQGRKTHKVGVTISIDKKYIDIPDHVGIMIMKRGLGSSYIEFRDIALDEPTAFLKDQMVLTGTVGMASEFFPPDVQKKLEHLVDSIAALADNTNRIMGDAQNQDNIKKTLENIQMAAAQAMQTFRSVEKFSDVSAEKVEMIGDKVGAVADQLEAALSEMRQLMAKIDSGEGTAGKLVNDGRLYENLLESSRELEIALEQIKNWAADAREKGVRIKW